MLYRYWGPILLFVLSRVYSTCLTNNHDGHNHHEHGSFSPFGPALKKAKQSAGSGFRRGPGSASDLCAQQCFHNLETELTNDPEIMPYVEKQKQPYHFEDRFNPAMLTKLCGILNQTFDCLEPCPSGEFKDIAENNLVDARFVCVNSNTLKNAPCIYKVTKESTTRCDSQCADKKTNMQSAIVAFSSVDDVANILVTTCVREFTSEEAFSFQTPHEESIPGGYNRSYVDCDTGCDRPTIKQECGVEALRDYLGVYKTGVDSMPKMLQVYGISVEMPFECNGIGVLDDE